MSQPAGRSADVAIVGGGIVGTATATFLARAGVRVTLYERNAIAAGASGRDRVSLVERDPEIGRAHV